MHSSQRIIDLSLILFLGVLWGLFMVFGWTSPLEGRTLSPIGDSAAERAGIFGAIHGTIQDEGGSPLEGARIRLLEPGNERPLLVTESDDLGRYSIEEWTAGLFILQVAHPGYGTTRRIVMAEVNGRCLMDVTLVPAVRRR